MRIEIIEMPLWSTKDREKRDPVTEESARGRRTEKGKDEETVERVETSL